MPSENREHLDIIPENADITNVIKTVNAILIHLELATPNNDIKESIYLVNSFIEKYPTRTPGGRVLSPARANTIQGKKISKKLIRVTKGNPSDIRKIITSLEEELEYRKRVGNIEFMKNIETWVNNGEWENSYTKNSTEAVIGIPKGKLI